MSDLVFILLMVAITFTIVLLIIWLDGQKKRKAKKLYASIFSNPEIRKHLEAIAEYEAAKLLDRYNEKVIPVLKNLNARLVKLEPKSKK